ncbi:MAG: hypothetical protein IKC11_02960 [Clostridia bacterium]|nr:hypothetical protein [Clostridia bacterium]
MENEIEKKAEEKTTKVNSIVSRTTELLIDELKEKGIDISKHKEMIEKNIRFCVATVLISVML